MPFIPVPNVVRSSLIYLADNQVIVNTLHFYKAGGVVLADMQALNTALHTWFTASLRGTLPSTTALSAINTVLLDSASSPSSLLAISPLEAGTAGAGAMPYNVAWCASLRTSLRGRNFRGRWYHPGVPTNQVVAPSSFLAAAMSGIQAALGQLLTPANVANFAWVIASRYFNKLPRVTGVANNVTAVTGDLTLDSQRRRLPGRGA